MSDTFVFKGVAKKKGEVEEISDKFQKRGVTFTVQDGQYENDIHVEFVNGHADASDNITEGSTYEVNCNIRSREYNDRWFTSVSGWKWNKVASF